MEICKIAMSENLKNLEIKKNFFFSKIKFFSKNGGFEINSKIFVNSQKNCENIRKFIKFVGNFCSKASMKN